MEKFAEIYVNYLEPTFKVLLFIMAVFGVIWLVDILRTPSSWVDISKKFFSILITSINSTGMFIWATVSFIVVGTIRIFRVCFATIRDFFISRI